MKSDILPFIGKGLLITACILPLILMFLITKGLIWLTDHIIKRK